MANSTSNSPDPASDVQAAVSPRGWLASSEAAQSKKGVMTTPSTARTTERVSTHTDGGAAPVSAWARAGALPRWPR